MQTKYTLLIVKGIVTFASLIYGVLPAIADLNETHLFNPGWSPHARVHGAWFLFYGFFMASLAIYLLWIRNELVLPIVIGLCFVAGFWLAFLTSSFYGGALVDEGGVEARVLGLESNVFVFSVLGLLLAGCLTVVLSRRATGSS